MSIIRFCRTALGQAARDAAQSGYVVDAAVSRPWLRLLALVLLSAVFALLGLFVLVGVVSALGVDTTAFAGQIRDGSARLDGEVVFIALLAASLLVVAGAALAAAMTVYRRPATAFLCPGPPFSLRLLFIGFAVMAALCLLIWPVSEWLDPMTGLPPLFDA